MVICLKVKTLDSQTYDFSVDDEISVRQFKECIAEKTNISADLQRIIYCGRVLVDEKQLKEYDVNGKVVHVVERPPPSSRPVISSGENSGRRQRDGLEGNIRGSPIFRTLDGMVLGAMTIPVATNGAATQPTAQPLNPSSTFCMNRITVARHMLECANNIASYLENPERGLNNSPLDILTQGRWTMESTVVEVGISSTANVDIPQNQTQNIVEALRGAVSAAMRQNGHQNVTVVQLPTVFGATGGPPSIAGETNPQMSTSTTSTAETADTDDQADATAENEANEANAASRSAEANEEPANVEPQEQPPPRPSVTVGGNSNTGSPTRRMQRTGTRTLAEVVQQMRTVQTRLEPFIQQYYEILLNDPTFEENDTAGRENSQRIYDRVSEALHYMSHAQHAISDLMLDLSQTAPRHLCCRPILVEQSGFVSSNQFMAPFLQPNGNNNESSAANNNNTNSSSNTNQQNESNSGPGGLPGVTFIRPSAPPPAAQQAQSQASANANATDTSAAGGGGPPTATTASAPSTASVNLHQSPVIITGQGQPQTQPSISTRGLHRILSPLFIPMSNRMPPTANAGNPNSENTNQANPQLEVARLIQAVVNSAPVDADVHVQINAPNLLTFGMPVLNPAVAQQMQNQNSSQSGNGGVSSNNTTGNSESNNNSESSQPRVTTATHPTTSTQTRSTARPQVHVANIPSSQMWNARVIPANMLSSFDRFLPCSSHHIRDNEMGDIGQPIPNIYPRARSQTRQRRQQAQESSTASTPRSTTTTQPPSSTRSSSSEDIFNLSNEDFNTPLNLFGSNLTLRDLIDIAPSPSTLNRIRSELHAFIVNNLFAGAPITDENMNEAINQVMQLLNGALIFLPQFDLPDYDARASVENFIRNTLPLIINLIREDDSNEFGTRLLRELISFVRRLFVILVTCVGRSNAELYLNQVAQMTITSNNAIEQEALRVLQRHLMSAVIRELDLTRQNTGDVQEFLVIRRPQAETSSTSTVTPMETDDVPETVETPAESDKTQSQMASPTSIEETQLPLPAPLVPDSNDPLPSVTVGSEPWHSNFPSNWLPIITRDISRQRRQSPQGPFSDAYISGMTSKRRKLVTSTKPPTDVPTLLSDGVRRALQQVGLANSGTGTVNSDEVTSAISSDPIAQTSYHEAMRSNIQERLRTDPDYMPDKYPNSAKYFNK